MCLGRLPTYRDISPKFGHVVVVGAEELCEPTDGSLAAFVHGLISFKVLIVFVDWVVGQMHVELALWRQALDISMLTNNLLTLFNFTAVQQLYEIALTWKQI